MACNWHRGLIVKNGSNDKIVNSAPWRLIFHKLQCQSNWERTDIILTEFYHPWWM
jgi:hypothetical protein